MFMSSVGGLVDHGALLLSIDLELGILQVLGLVLDHAEGPHVHVLGALSALLRHGPEVDLLPALVHLTLDVGMGETALLPRVHLWPAGLPEAGLVGVETLVALLPAGVSGPVPNLGPAPPALVGLLHVNHIVSGGELSAVGAASHPDSEIVHDSLPHVQMLGRSSSEEEGCQAELHLESVAGDP